MNNFKYRKFFAWGAVLISAAFANFWAYWGINENFHEGWYFESIWNNLALMFGQYLLVPLGFMLVSCVAIRWNKTGAALFFALATGSYFLFGRLNAGFFLVFLPLAGLGLLYLFGKPERRWLAYLLTAGLPTLLILVIGAYHLIRVSGRYNDNQFGARAVKGNGVTLIWAPQGPGWPDRGTSWKEAKTICAHLNADGTKLENKPVNVWRLPSVDEAVRSMVYHGYNAGGTWDSLTRKTYYKTQPDKESPLWNIRLKTIYWWTSTEADSLNAYIIVYNGGVWRRKKTTKADYLNFRAVKEF